MRLIWSFGWTVAIATAAMVCTAGTGPIGYWPLDEGTGTTTADATGNGNVGTLINTPTWVAGKVGNALSFPGTTPYVSINGAGNLVNLQNTGLTVMAWIKPNTAGAGGVGRIVDKGNTTSTVGWWFTMLNATTIRLQVATFPTVILRRDSGSIVSLGAWQHVAAVWDGTTNVANAHIYINGVLSDGVGQSGVGAPQSDAALTLAIGNRASDTARGFNGLIDDARVYNRVLTSAEIQTIASDTQTPTAPSAAAAAAAATSSTQINVSWTAATDNVGVTGYIIERCLGTTCTNFTPVATVAASPYSNTGLVVLTTYRYRIRATDAAGLLGAYSNTAIATTKSIGEVVNYGYDALGRLIVTSITSGPRASTNTQLTYDPEGNRTTLTTTGVPPLPTVSIGGASTNEGSALSFPVTLSAAPVTLST